MTPLEASKRLTEFECDLLRELNDEPRGLFWGAAMGEALASLARMGYLHRVQHPDKIAYVLSESGRKVAEVLKGAP